MCRVRFICLVPWGRVIITVKSLSYLKVDFTVLGTSWHVWTVKMQTSLISLSFWNEETLNLATHRAHIEDYDQTAQMCSLI